MKLRKLSLLFLSFILMLSVMPANALLSDNVHNSELIPQQAWYTKLIKFNNLKRGDISGTIKFELVPDNEVKDKGIKYINYGNDPSTEEDNGAVEVIPGLTTYKYDLPFSSEDYSDDTFNNLAWASGNRAGDSNDLFNHAFLHEWGRVQSSDHCTSFNVGKLDPKQFENAIPYLYANKEEAMIAYNKQKTMLENFAAQGKALSWAGDNDTEGVIGWYRRNDGFQDAKDPLYDFLGSEEEGGSENLNEFGAFRDGSFKVIDHYTLLANPAVTYFLRMTTRPIAIGKTYDADGNITSIEKPLLSCTEAYKFYKDHYAKLKEANGGDDEASEYAENKIFRYRLQEKSVDGLAISNGDIIVDIMSYYSPDTPQAIFMFDTEKSADSFYNKYFGGEQSSLSSIFDKEAGVKITKDNKVQMVNDLTNVHVKKVWKDSKNKYKDRPESVKVNLLSNGTKTQKSLILNKDNGWTDVFTNLPMKDISGKDIQYTIQEESIKNYSTKTTGDEVNGFVITNTHKEVKEPNKEKKTPRTADSENLLFFAGLMSLGLAGIYLTKRRKEDKKK